MLLLERVLAITWLFLIGLALLLKAPLLTSVLPLVSVPWSSTRLPDELEPLELNSSLTDWLDAYLLTVVALILGPNE